MPIEDRRGARSERLAAMALAVALTGAICFVAAVALYEEPKSFYVNFVLLPSLGLMAAGAFVDLVAIVLAVVALSGPARRKAWLALGLAVAIPALAAGTIQLVLRN